MSTISHAHRPGNSRQPYGQRLWCPRCRTDQHLAIDAIEQPSPPEQELVEVSYTCVGCDFLYAHAATVAQAAAILNRPGPARTPGILQFGGAYIHCGEPMHTAGSDEHSIYAPMSTEQSSEPVLDVYLRTRVLKCSCGFQMEIPD
ncbi:hypothetical protein [Arthrobacter sp. U41]|uniref:hypothetical protein n=1 Tax=Arthrobacter sp. U41 TaxID=1849032 RepID=UPI00085956FD|nr:hypothetical protein [Arthrobacter sp. U41]AOT05764.1 hypothetical protein ASPU41_20145 [Arthrobacter sp. U41]AOT05896.1 hypothetical protein ASPU41_20810 [Arthrobacter sp. U41]